MATKFKSVTTQLLMLGLVAGLSACGGNNSTPAATPAPAASTPPPVVTTPPATTTANDYVGQYIIPQLQSFYGNITINTAVTVQGVTFAPGSQSWAQVYSQVTQMHSNASSCNIASPAQTTTTTTPSATGAMPWMNFNYGCFYNYMGTNPSEINSLEVATVSFANYPNSSASLFMVIDMLVRYNYSLWTSYFSNYYGYNYTGSPWPVYSAPGYNGNQVSGGLSFNNGNLGINLGGIFNWGH